MEQSAPFNKLQLLEGRQSAAGIKEWKKRIRMRSWNGKLYQGQQ